MSAAEAVGATPRTSYGFLTTCSARTLTAQNHEGSKSENLQHASPQTRRRYRRCDAGSRAWSRPNASADSNHLALVGMTGVRIFRHILFLLGRHPGGVRLARHSSRAELSPLDVVLGQSGLSIVELPVASVTRFHVWPPAR